MQQDALHHAQPNPDLRVHRGEGGEGRVPRAGPGVGAGGLRVGQKHGRTDEHAGAQGTGQSVSATVARGGQAARGIGVRRPHSANRPLRVPLQITLLRRPSAGLLLTPSSQMPS